MRTMVACVAGAKPEEYAFARSLAGQLRVTTAAWVLSPESISSSEVLNHRGVAGRIRSGAQTVSFVSGVRLDAKNFMANGTSFGYAAHQATIRSSLVRSSCIPLISNSSSSTTDSSLTLLFALLSYLILK